ncbi:DUF4179 domain-containing protein [Alkaliphilus oremlandii]|uniref:Putative transmembrane anti-sigma factor n=1 Tax=Alkaliphilus oremlandii (strain OhILAs) TaxID=350688 RepID=A8MM87_ALKOO|nr:DUF4179 domain-containing protein [Alkaliphilus oremlandii]ABW18254.1 putative transmembrane anti-sigma factor [Alkaliphilus oremlandii OhILAs]
MLCKDVKEKIIDYIEDLLDKESYLAVEHHIKNCSRCQQEIKEIRESIGYVESMGNAMIVPEGFMESVKNKVEHNKKLGKKPKRRVGTAIFVAALIAVLITGVFAEEGIKSYFEEWKSKSLEESQSIEQLITEGYGEKLGISTEDQDIKITVESIMADDMNTVLLIEVEDLKGEKKYAPIRWRESTFANGNFNYLSPDTSGEPTDKSGIMGDFILHSPEENITRAVVAFSPIASDYEEIELVINALEVISDGETRLPHAIGGQYYYDKHRDRIVDGLWTVKIPVQPSKSKIFDIHEEMDLDGHTITFDKLIISPTMTTLTYHFNKRQDPAYILNSLRNITMEADGKLYNRMKSFGRGSMYPDPFGPTKGSISFDTMYFEIPKKIKITVEDYEIAVKEQKTLEISPQKPFPQDFEYLGSKIRVNNVRGDENLIRVSMDNLGEKYFERLMFEILINNKRYTETLYAVKPLVPDNLLDRRVLSYDILLNNTAQDFKDYPAGDYMVSSSFVNYYEYETKEEKIEDLKLKDTLDESIKSVRIQIEGYEENRNATGSVSFKLKKYKERPSVEK